jgi:tetratricopeptide (TPR) repeat protein
LPDDDRKDRVNICLSVLSILVLTFCVLVMISLTPLSSVLAKNISTEVKTLIDKGKAFFKLGNYTEAITYYDKALAIDPKDTKALYYKGAALDSLGNLTGAIVYYDKVLAINATDIGALNDKGLSLSRLGKNAEAIVYYDKVLAINATDTRALYNKGLALDRLGNHTSESEKAIFMKLYQNGTSFDSFFK